MSATSLRGEVTPGTAAGPLALSPSALTFLGAWSKLQLAHCPLLASGGCAMPEEEKKPVSREKYFCPYCFQMTFEASVLKEYSVYCEICGVEVECKELVKE
jgi:hypothetical protein